MGPLLLITGEIHGSIPDVIYDVPSIIVSIFRPVDPYTPACPGYSIFSLELF